MKFLRFHIALLYFSLVLLQLGEIESTDSITQSVGTHCTCRTLFLICYSMNKKARHWKPCDLHDISNKGSYESLGYSAKFLVLDDLSKAALLKNY